ncbi:SRPBCC family protein [Nocardioides sp.]|uniref:SRPBCC family protein n=1 Tax=Nocardioides sp. TaxID=35761 RepID=UPI00356ADC0E
MARTWRFESRWPLPGPRHEVYAVLADVERYPEWWPGVRAVGRLDEQRGLVLVRSVLPLTLDLVLTSVREDPDAGVLEVAIDGDLRGWSRFTLAEDLIYEQEVTTPKWFMNLAPRWILRLNHAAVMRAAEQGLRARLAG